VTLPDGSDFGVGLGDPPNPININSIDVALNRAWSVIGAIRLRER
jgi:hypothetical protein